MLCGSVGCGILIAMTCHVDELLLHAAELIEGGRRVALCLLGEARGSTPAPAGSLMLVDDAANLMGTIGGGCVEAEVRRRVVEMLGRGRTGVLHFKLDHDYGWDDGLICGGSIDVAVGLPGEAASLRTIALDHRDRRPTQLELVVSADDSDGGGMVRYVLDLPPRPRLLIAGAGHVGQALCRLASPLGFDVVVFDDRGDLLERFIPDPADRVVGPIHERMAAERIDDQTSIVIVTRGHRHDEQVLASIVDRPAGYIGMIGSRRKVKLTFDDLRQAGVSDEALAKVHAPIGLDIGAVTVSEIALSIGAQLVAVRRADHRSPVRGPLPNVISPQRSQSCTED